jgi:hypothetical protein
MGGEKEKDNGTRKKKKEKEASSKIWNEGMKPDIFHCFVII